MSTLWTIVLAIIPSLLILYVTRQLNKMGKRSEAAEELRRKESVLILENIDAIGTLANKTAVCVKNERVNGDMDEALAYQAKKKHEIETYLYAVNAALPGR